VGATGIEPVTPTVSR